MKRSHLRFYPRAHPYLFRGVDWGSSNGSSDSLEALSERELARQPRRVLWIQDERTGYRRFDIDSDELENYEPLCDSDDDNPNAEIIVVQMRPSSPSLSRPSPRRLKHMSWARQRALFDEQEEEEEAQMAAARSAWDELEIPSPNVVVNGHISVDEADDLRANVPLLNDDDAFFGGNDDDVNDEEAEAEPAPEPAPRRARARDPLPEHLRCVVPGCPLHRRTRHGEIISPKCDAHSRKEKPPRECIVCQKPINKGNKAKCATCRRRVTAANKQQGARD